MWYRWDDFLFTPRPTQYPKVPSAAFFWGLANYYSILWEPLQSVTVNKLSILALLQENFTLLTNLTFYIKILPCDILPY